MQTETISAVFETYFRILKHTMMFTAVRCVPILYNEELGSVGCGCDSTVLERGSTLLFGCWNISKYYPR